MYTMNQKKIMSKIQNLGGDQDWVLLSKLGSFDQEALEALVGGGFIQMGQDDNKRSHVALGALELGKPSIGTSADEVDLSKLGI